MSGRSIWVGICAIAAIAAAAGFWYGLFGTGNVHFEAFDTAPQFFVTLAGANVAMFALAVIGGALGFATNPLAFISACVLVASAILSEMWIGPYVIPGAVLALVAAIGWNLAVTWAADDAEARTTYRRY